MSLIVHVLYCTVGDTFEQYLTVEDLNIMRQVCSTTRDTEKVNAMLKCWKILPESQQNPIRLSKKIGTDPMFVAEVMMFLYRRKKMDFLYAHLGMWKVTSNEKYMDAIKDKIRNICDEHEMNAYRYACMINPYNVWLGGTILDDEIMPIEMIKKYRKGSLDAKGSLGKLCYKCGFNYAECLKQLDKVIQHPAYC